jgi:hypothetical protein
MRPFSSRAISRSESAVHGIVVSVLRVVAFVRRVGGHGPFDSFGRLPFVAGMDVAMEPRLGVAEGLVVDAAQSAVPAGDLDRLADEREIEQETDTLIDRQIREVIDGSVLAEQSASSQADAGCRRSRRSRCACGPSPSDSRRDVLIRCARRARTRLTTLSARAGPCQSGSCRRIHHVHGAAAGSCARVGLELQRNGQDVLMAAR